MQVATWNMGYWGHSKAHDEAWRWLLNDLRPDIALLQECVVPDWVADDYTVIFERAYPGSRQRWGTAVVSRGLPTTPARLPEVEEWLAHLGPEAPNQCSATRLYNWFVPAEVTLEDGTKVRRRCPIDVFKYLDYRAFLDAFYRAKKPSGFSYRAFSRRAGLGAPNYLKLVIEGQRNLTADMAARSADACARDGEAARYFVALVEFNQARESDARDAAYKKLSGFRRYRR